MSRKSIGEALGVLGVIASLGFVGMELRQSNIEARAAAFQGIGAQLNEFHQFVASDSTLNRLYLERRSPTSVARWSIDDWNLFMRSRIAALRIAETTYLQGEQRLLDDTAMEQLGGFRANTEHYANACIWPVVSRAVAPSFRRYLESTYPNRPTCESSEGLVSFLAAVDP